MEINKKLINIFNNLKEIKPLVHHITNYVTVNDCGNITLAIGASPVMSDAIDEVEDMVSIASAVVINIGTLNNVKVDSMIKAGKKANELGIPVILDPVGVGATPYRKDTALKLIKEIKFAVIRGNLAEIKVLCGMNSLSKGVDSEESDLTNAKEVALTLSKTLNTVIAITGVFDYISDGSKVIVLKNGHEMLKNVTGTGCMTTSLIGSYCGASKDYMNAAVLGVMTMGIAGEIAYENLNKNEGSGSFRVKLMDAIYNFSIDDISKRGKAYEE